VPRMTTADAAVAILRREGITNVFGLPGAAINPFYAAMRRDGGIRHTLARHVEGASHMAEGYTRVRAGNIGGCVGTSGPAGTDMITGLYSASADSIPILCITGQAPVARLHKEDFQAVDIASIAAPVTKMATTVLEPAQVPGVFAQAFHLMRSGRPGPVLIDLPFDVQMAEIDFDPGTYEPLPVYKPAATRAQIDKALDMLGRAGHPLIVAGGGIINADAGGLLAAFAVDPPRLHAGGPFSDRPAGGADEMSEFVALPALQEQAWRTRVQQLQRSYRDGIDQLDRLAGGDFTSAAPAQQDRVLARAEVAPFLDTLFTHAIEGMYSVPEYGGNASLRGWQDIGWPGDRQPVGYPPAQVSQPTQVDVLHPTGVVAKLLRLLDPAWTDSGGG